MAYPRTTDQRLKFFTNQITHTRARIKPTFDACNVLANQYYQNPATEREQSTGGRSEDEVTRRTKAGIIYGWIDQSLANMLEQEPVFQCFPENRFSAERYSQDPNSPTRAGVAAKVNNHIYQDTNQLRVDERVALDAMLFPYGGAKIGYTVDFDARTQELLQTDTEAELENPADENLFLAVGEPTLVTEHQDHVAHIEEHTVLLQGSLLNISPMQQEIVEVVVKDHIRLHKIFMDRSAPSANTNVKQESVFAVRWAPDMLMTDLFSLEGPQDARWMAFGWELPIEEVQADASYENTRDLTPSRWKDAPAKDSELDSDGFDIVRGWEIWAKNFPIGRGKFRDLVLTIAEGHDKFLRYDEEWPYDRLEDYPGEVLTFQTGMRRWFDKPPLLMGGADTTQALMNEILDSYLNIIRKQKNVWLVDPETGIGKTQLQDILDAADGGVVEVPGLAEAGGKSVMPLPFHEIPSEKGEMLSVIQSIFDRSNGTPQPVQMPHTDTATEASILEKRNTARENRRSQLLSEFQIRKQRKMWQLVTQFQPSNLYLIDPHAPEFVKVTPEVAKGEYRFTMDLTSHSTALAVERSQWMDLLNLFAGLTPILQQTTGMAPNLAELARRLLVRGFNEKLVDTILPMLSPQAQAQAQAQAQQAQPQPAEGQGTTEGIENPEAQVLDEAIRGGQKVGSGVGPLLRDSFNNEIPSEGHQQGEGNRG